MEHEIQPLSRVALNLGGFHIHWYGIIIGIGVVLGLFLAIKESERRGLHKDLFVDLILFALPIALIFARIYYVVFEWSYYSQHPSEIIKIWNGGIAIHGALIGSVLTAIVFARVKKISFWKIADIAAPSLLLGQAIGRWGNFVNQEAHGGEVSRLFLENLQLPSFIIDQMYINGTYYHPTFLYESLWNLIGIGLLLLLRKVNVRHGEIFISYIIWYSIGRFFIEGLRTDSLMLTETLRMAQVISLALIVLGVSLFLYRRFISQTKQRYLDV